MQTKLYMMKETSPYLLGMVIVTEQNRCVIVERLMGSSPVWLYDEPDVPTYLSDRERLVRMKRIRMYGSALTRRWMDVLGVKEHYVSFTGTKEILL